MTTLANQKHHTDGDSAGTVAMIGAAQRFHAGSREAENAFAQLVAEYQPVIDRNLNRMLDNHADRAELSQEIWAKVARKLPEFKFESKFSTWLTRVTRNFAINFIKKEARRRQRLQTAEEIPEPPENNDLPWSRSKDLMMSLMRDEERPLVIDAISKAKSQLPEETREICRLKEEGLQSAQIGHSLSLPPGTVRSRLSHANQHIYATAISMIKFARNRISAIFLKNIKALQ